MDYRKPPMRSRRGTLCRAKRVDQAHYRPPNYETPPTHFTSEFTPNEFCRPLSPRRHSGRNRRREVEAQSDGDGVGGHWNWGCAICHFKPRLVEVMVGYASDVAGLLRIWDRGSSASGQAPDHHYVEKGRHLALMLCTDCHLVAPKQPYAPKLNPPAPSFQSIA